MRHDLVGLGVAPAGTGIVRGLVRELVIPEDEKKACRGSDEMSGIRDIMVPANRQWGWLKPEAVGFENIP